MPEGDTVYLTARRMDAALAGQRLLHAELRHPRWVEHDLTGRTVHGVVSIGKHLFTRFDSQLSLHSHLRMDGSWHIYPIDSRSRRRGPDHQIRALLQTASRTIIGYRLHDLELLPTHEEHRLVGHLGPDLLDPGWSPKHAELAVRGLTADPSTELGLALLDQRIMAGVGNLYRNEICFLLRSSPWVTVGELPEPMLAVTLARRLLLRNAERPEQSTTGELGRGREHWVYRRHSQPCRRCSTRIRSGAQGDGVYARTAYYCPRCQSGPVPLSPGSAAAGSG